MVDETPRLGLNTFSQGESWDYTDTVETVDESAIVRGLIKDRPASGRYDDELYHATDQRITWRWDASSNDWQVFGGNGTASQPVPGTSHFENTNTSQVIEGVGQRTEVTDHGAWTWMPRRGVRHVGSSDKTYIGYMDPDGQPTIASINHDTGAINRTALGTVAKDDHMPPGIEVLPDGTIAVFYNDRGNNATEMFYRTSNTPEDITDLSAEQTLTDDTRHNYPNPWYVPGEDRLYLFYRGSGHCLRYYYSDDSGATWSASQDLITSTQIYWQAFGNDGDKVHFAITDRPSAVTNEMGVADIYHMYFEGGTLYTSDGTAIGATATLSDLTQVYDTSATGRQAWAWSIASHNGNPEIVYTTFVVGEWDHVYRWARWDGSQWNDTRLTDGGYHLTEGTEGQRGYAGGVTTDPEEPGVVYASVIGDSAGTIYRLKTPDDGETWQRTQWTDGVTKNCRPYVPANRHQDMPVFWMRGRYYYYANGLRNGQEVQWQTGIYGGRDSAPPIGTNRNKSAYRAGVNSTVDIPTGTATNVEMDNILYDVLEEATSGYFRPKYGGIYHVDISVEYQPISAGGTFELRVDGGADDKVTAAAGEEPSLHGSGVIRRHGRETPTDSSVTFFCQVEQDTGATQTLKSGMQKTTMSVTQLR